MTKDNVSLMKFVSRLVFIMRYAEREDGCIKISDELANNIDIKLCSVLEILKAKEE